MFGVWAHDFQFAAARLHETLCKLQSELFRTRPAPCETVVPMSCKACLFDIFVQFALASVITKDLKDSYCSMDHRDLYGSLRAKQLRAGSSPQ